MDFERELFDINRLVSSRGLEWVQGPGGNISWKTADRLFIKPSGARLDELRSLSDLAEVDLAKFRLDFQLAESLPSAQREGAYKDAIGSASLRPAKRPSMETGFHAFLPAAFVVHVHSLAAVLLAQRIRDDRPSFERWLAQQTQWSLLSWEFLPAMMPGLELAAEVKKRSASSVLFLENHGVVLQLRCAAELQNYLDFEQVLKREFLGTQPGLLESECEGPAPFRAYFPDAVILEERIRRNLEAATAENTWVYARSRETDVDAWENWQAIVRLHRANSSLRALPPRITDSVKTLPTEIERKKVMGR